MRRNPHAPPSGAERLLAAVLGSSRRAESILGDLHEEQSGKSVTVFERSSAGRRFRES